MYMAPMALLSELKARLKITDTTDDAVLTEMLKGVSGAIESLAGRSLRRGHVMRERFAGGGSLIRVQRPPIAKIHWIRESYDYDFDDPDAYDELVEGTDYVLDTRVSGEEPGESGWIRKIGGDFIGDRDLPTMVEVCYTGGYKTPDEAALENSTLTFSGSVNTTLVDAFSVAARYIPVVGSDDPLEGYLAQFLAATVCKAGVEVSGMISKFNRACLVFRPGQVLIPTWEVVEATLTIRLHRSDGTGTLAIDGFILPYDPKTRLNDLAGLYADIGELDTGEILTDQASTAAAGAPDTITMTIHSDAAYRCGENMALLNACLRQGFLAFAFRNGSEAIRVALAGGIDTPRHATTAQRPTLVLVHRDTLNDPWSMPEDLRNATLLQVADDWQSRRWPGVKQETQRGVAISSGVSYMRDPSDLLPQVRRVAQHYAFFV